jgi:hypothetical protein
MARFRDKLNRSNLKRIARSVLSAFFGILGLFVLYLILLCHPGLFFRYAFNQGAITLYSDEPIPASAAQVLKVTEDRLARSPLYRERTSPNIRVYLCNRRWRFILFANIRHHVGGLTYPPLSNNIFLRGAHIDINRLIGPSGNDVPGERRLSYYIAHEAVHTLLFDELGVVAHWRLPRWKDDGYADYIAKGAEFDYARGVDQLRRGDRQMDPERSELYLRCNLLVTYLLDHQGIRVHELLKQDIDPERLEVEILKAR